jgi:hypothetical protein
MEAGEDDLSSTSTREGRGRQGEKMSPDPGKLAQRDLRRDGNRLLSIGLMVVGIVAPPSCSGVRVPSFVGKSRELPG